MNNYEIQLIKSKYKAIFTSGKRTPYQWHLIRVRYKNDLQTAYRTYRVCNKYNECVKNYWAMKNDKIFIRNKALQYRYNKKEKLFKEMIKTNPLMNLLQNTI